MGVEGQADLRRIRHTHAAEVGEVEVCLDLCLKLIDERALPRFSSSSLRRRHQRPLAVRGRVRRERLHRGGSG